MPELTAHQASGLAGLAEPTGPQLIAMVCRGEAQTELPVLWQLCGALCDLEYPVTVLDATQWESDENPGLLQWLDCRIGVAHANAQWPGCAIVPGAGGIEQFADAQQLQETATLFGHDGVVILYADTSTLVRLLAGTAVRPLLCACRERSSLLSGYQALKRLLQDGRLEPTILNMMAGDEPATSGAAQAPVHSDNLAECARQFLGFDVNSIQFDSSRSVQHRSMQMCQLAMRLLENALPLQATPATSATTSAATSAVTASAHHSVHPSMHASVPSSVSTFATPSALLAPGI